MDPGKSFPAAKESSPATPSKKGIEGSRYDERRPRGRIIHIQRVTIYQDQSQSDRTSLRVKVYIKQW